MKAKAVIIKDGSFIEVKELSTHLVLYFPFDKDNPFRERILPIQLNGSRANTKNWSWNGDLEKPTLKPSIKTNIGNGQICHSFVNDGKVQFLSDCTHEFKNQTIELLDIE